MKPNINLNLPQVKLIAGFYKARMRAALSAPQTVESAVFPVYCPMKHDRKLEQIGSCVILKIKDEHFALSASHVFDPIGDRALLISAGTGEFIEVLTGDRFSTARGKSGNHSDDPIDASVFHIQSSLHENIKKHAISIDDLDLDLENNERFVCMTAGFRVKESHTSWTHARAKRECFPSCEYDMGIYRGLGLKPDVHMALAHDDHVLIDGKWQNSPKPKGFSGGAMMKVEGVSVLPSISVATKIRQKLSAITIEQRREKNGNPGVIVGTRVRVHLSLIEKFLPGLI